MDELIKKYAERLQAIYDNQTAGHFTFEAILANFASEAKPLLTTAKQAEVDALRTRNKFEEPIVRNSPPEDLRLLGYGRPERD